jgi:hypothetical protein
MAVIGGKVFYEKFGIPNKKPDTCERTISIVWHISLSSRLCSGN